jgi:IS5 family transposase
VYADAGYQGIEKRCEADAVRWHVAMRPAKRRKLDLSDSLDAIYDQIERLKAGIRAKEALHFQLSAASAFRSLSVSDAKVFTARRSAPGRHMVFIGARRFKLCAKLYAPSINCPKQTAW